MTANGNLFVPHNLSPLMYIVSSGDARNALDVAHGFASLKQGIEGTLAIFSKHLCVQSDPIEVAGRNQDLTLHSRVSDYNQEYLNELLYTKKHLFEYYCKAFSIQPIEKYPYFHFLRKQIQEKNAPFFRKHEEETATLLKMMEETPLSSRDIAMGHSEGPIPLPRMILGRLWACGKVMIHHRRGAVKYYALTENTVPEKFRYEPGDEECVKEMTRIIVRASRIVSACKAADQWHFIGKTKRVRELLQLMEKEGDVFSIRLEKYKEPVYLPAEDRDIWEDPQPAESDHVRFLAPLDPLIWNRSLVSVVYGIEYSWEAYKKPEEREYGYYCLPVLFNGEIVGLIEPFFRKKDRVLEVRRFHLLNRETDSRRLRDAVEAELQRLSRNVGGRRIEMMKGSDMRIVNYTKE